MSLLEVSELTRVYGGNSRGTEALRGLTFEVEEGEFACVIGPSGCGKTTLLRCVSGLLAPTSGAVILRGERVVGPPHDMALSFRSTTAPSSRG